MEGVRTTEDSKAEGRLMNSMSKPYNKKKKKKRDVLKKILKNF